MFDLVWWFVCFGKNWSWSLTHFRTHPHQCRPALLETGCVAKKVWLLSRSFKGTKAFSSASNGVLSESPDPIGDHQLLSNSNGHWGDFSSIFRQTQVSELLVILMFYIDMYIDIDSRYRYRYRHRYRYSVNPIFLFNKNFIATWSPWLSAPARRLAGRCLNMLPRQKRRWFWG